MIWNVLSNEVILMLSELAHDLGDFSIDFPFNGQAINEVITSTVYI